MSGALKRDVTGRDNTTYLVTDGRRRDSQTGVFETVRMPSGTTFKLVDRELFDRAVRNASEGFKGKPITK